MPEEEVDVEKLNRTIQDLYTKIEELESKIGDVEMIASEALEKVARLE